MIRPTHYNLGNNQYAPVFYVCAQETGRPFYALLCLEDLSAINSCQLLSSLPTTAGFQFYTGVFSLTALNSWKCLQLLVVLSGYGNPGQLSNMPSRAGSPFML